MSENPLLRAALGYARARLGRLPLSTARQDPGHRARRP